MKLKKAQVKEVRNRILAAQDGVCPLCREPIPPGMETLDHDHSTGFIREVLCRNCNSMEGKIMNASTRAKRSSSALEWLHRCLGYVIYHKENPTQILHYTYMTKEEKLAKRKRKASRATPKRTRNASTREK